MLELPVVLVKLPRDPLVDPLPLDKLLFFVLSIVGACARKLPISIRLGC